jgi:hypothetical protein
MRCFAGLCYGCGATIAALTVLSTFIDVLRPMDVVLSKCFAGPLLCAIGLYFRRKDATARSPWAPTSILISLPLLHLLFILATRWLDPIRSID